MTRNVVIVFIITLVLASCGTTRPVSSVSRPVASRPTASTPKPAAPVKKDVKFLDEITVNNQLTASIPAAKAEPEESSPVAFSETKAEDNASSETTAALRLKYASLIGTLPELLENADLLRSIDFWYGTRYLMGGTTKSGIDCSAFVQSVYLTAFAMSIPRTAFEQYRVTNRISAVEMREGDLVFFNTTGGVSHVGIYLTNNKFVHASSSKGVTISDLFDPYYLKRFLGVGRVERPMSGTR